MEIDVRHIAQLAMLQLPEDQVEAMKQEFASFIAMAEYLPDVESDCEPGNVDAPLESEDRMSLREDVVVPSYPREAMLQNAPETAAGCIALPKTLEGLE